ncbi:MAG: hypothetical protein H6807_16425 [Planctomycetes bacterium]|nr:hypothetical protein [Planctomycetota bacterium]
MTLNIKPGETLLELSTVTPLNVATGDGDEVDRLLVRDSWTGLPFIPDSALKGVIAAAQRTEAMGTEDGVGVKDWSQGRPSTLVFGEARLLSFPYRLRGGEFADVVPASTLGLLVRLGHATGCPAIDARALLSREIDPADLHTSSLRAPAEALASLPGGLRQDRPLAVAGDALAVDLLAASVMDIQSTALDPDRRAATGSLRSLEVCPAGSRFLSWVSSLGKGDVSLPVTRIQIGGMESVGIGFATLRLFTAGSASGAERATGSWLPTPIAETEIAEATRRLHPDDRKKLLKPIRDLHRTWRRQGIEAALVGFDGNLAGLERELHGGAKAVMSVKELLLGSDATRVLEAIIEGKGRLDPIALAANVDKAIQWLETW